MHHTVRLLYFVFGLLQIYAIANYMYFEQDWPSVYFLPVSILVGYVPFLGAMIAMYSAGIVWGWSLLLLMAGLLLSSVISYFTITLSYYEADHILKKVRKNLKKRGLDGK